MKRDMDLVREILLAVEGGTLSFGDEDEPDGLDHPRDVVLHHLHLMEQAGLVEVMFRPLSGEIHLRGLTWAGHEFLDTVRDPEVWKRTKEGASKVGGWTFGLIKDLGTAYLKHVAKERLKLDL